MKPDKTGVTNINTISTESNICLRKEGDLSDRSRLQHINSAHHHHHHHDNARTTRARTQTHPHMDTLAGLGKNLIY